jgi:hypothetical protein
MSIEPKGWEQSKNGSDATSTLDEKQPIKKLQVSSYFSFSLILALVKLLFHSLPPLSCI